MKLTILMPCLNESETIGSCIHKAKKWISANNLSRDCEILIADNGSVDGSQELARSLGARVLNVKQRGYGNALFYGSLDANGQFIIMADSDDSYDFSDLSPFYSMLEKGYDLVMGNRFLGGIQTGAMPWKNKYIGNPFLSWVGRLLFSCPANDFHCGLRGFTKEAFLKMDLRTTGMEFASEMVIKANLFSMKICEVPTTLSKDGRSRPPHLRPWRDGWRHLRFMMLFSPKWLFFIPGLLITILSSIVYCLIYPSPLQIANILFDVHTLFYAESGVVLGYLSMLIGLTIKMFGIREGLLQDDISFQKISNSPILEIGTLLSLLIMGTGCFVAFNALMAWSEVGFGILKQGELLRKVSLSTMLILLGGVSALFSLVMGFLALPLRRTLN